MKFGRCPWWKKSETQISEEYSAKKKEGAAEYGERPSNFDAGRMIRPRGDVVSWTKRVSALARSGRAAEAVAAFARMDAEPNALTLANVLVSIGVHTHPASSTSSAPSGVVGGWGRSPAWSPAAGVVVGGGGP